MSKKLEKGRDGVIILKEDTPEKMEVESNEIDASEAYHTTPVYIYYNWCKRCGICVNFCPTGTLARKADGTPYVKNPENCIHCETCDRLCPDFAITGAKEKGQGKDCKGEGAKGGGANNG